MAGVEQDRVTLDRELARLLADGEKIAAIKLLRERSGMGLAEAKDAVDRAAAAAAVPAASATEPTGFGLALRQGPARPRAAGRSVLLALRTLIALLVLGAAIWRALR